MTQKPEITGLAERWISRAFKVLGHHVVGGAGSPFSLPAFFVPFIVLYEFLYDIIQSLEVSHNVRF